MKKTTEVKAALYEDLTVLISAIEDGATLDDIDGLIWAIHHDAALLIHVLKHEKENG